MKDRSRKKKSIIRNPLDIYQKIKEDSLMGLGDFEGASDNALTTSTNEISKTDGALTSKDVLGDLDLEKNGFFGKDDFYLPTQISGIIPTQKRCCDNGKKRRKNA